MDVLAEFFCSLTLVARLVSACVGGGSAIAGYVEGEYVLLAPIEVAQVVTVAARRGDRLPAGATVAQLERADVDLVLTDANAKLAEVQAELPNLHRGRRPEEIAVIEATLNSAQAQARDGARALSRRQDLFARGNTSQAELDQALTTRDVAEARVRELQANLAVARLPARTDEIHAAENRVAQAQAAVAQAEWRRGQRTLATPAAGRVADVIRRAGEVAGPAAPVVSFLPDGAAKLKIFVPEALLAQAQIGRRLAVVCDGCGDATTAVVTYVSPDPEFTPPVIYSVEARQKLVYLVEARPDSGATRLQPGQIVDVRFLPPTGPEGVHP